MVHVRATVVIVLLLVVADGVRADLRCAAQTVTVGEIRSGLPLSQEFRLVNDGPETVEVIAVQPSCGCLAPRLDQRQLAAGEGTVLRMEVNTLGQPAGPHAWQVRLQYRRGETVQEMLLEMKGTIVTEITVQPAALTLFARGNLTQEVVVTDTRPHPFRVREVRTTSPHLQAVLLSPLSPRGRGERGEDAAARHSYRILLEAQTGYPPGRHEEILSIYTDDPVYQLLKVNVTVVRGVGERLTVTPEEVLAAAAPGKPVSARLLLVRDGNDETVVVESVTADDPAIQCRWAAGPEKLATVRVQIDRTKLTGPSLRSAVHVHVASPVREVLTVPVICTLE